MWAKRLLIAVFAGCSLARNGSKGSTPAVRFRKRERPESARSRHGDRPERRHLPRYRRFESGFLQRRVSNELGSDLRTLATGVAAAICARFCASISAPTALPSTAARAMCTALPPTPPAPMTLFSVGANRSVSWRCWRGRATPALGDVGLMVEGIGGVARSAWAPISKPICPD
jgi:hypothetical protein